MAVMLFILLALPLHFVIGPIIDEVVLLTVEMGHDFLMLCDFLQVAGFFGGSS